MNAVAITGRERALEKILWAVEMLKGTNDADERAECCHWAAQINGELEEEVMKRGARAAAEAAAETPNRISRRVPGKAKTSKTQTHTIHTMKSAHIDDDKEKPDGEKPGDGDGGGGDGGEGGGKGEGEG